MSFELLTGSSRHSSRRNQRHLQEAVMKVFRMVLAITVLAAAPSFAQEKGVQDPSGYVSGFGGAVWSAGNSSSGVLFEGGRRIASHLMAFGNVGRFTNLQGDLERTLDAATASLAAQGVGVASGGTQSTTPLCGFSGFCVIVVALQ
jgi:hypothetical protein